MEKLVGDKGKNRDMENKTLAPEKKGDPRVEIFGDGSCLTNPGPGGWGSIIRLNGKDTELSGCAPHTTNNIMELTAILEPLKLLMVSSVVTITTDSEYVVKGMNQWVRSWAMRGWVKKKGGNPVKNRALWEELLNMKNIHQINCVWVRGHNGHPENERCDELAFEAAMSLRIPKPENWNSAFDFPPLILENPA